MDEEAFVLLVVDNKVNDVILDFSTFSLDLLSQVLDLGFVDKEFGLLESHGLGLRNNVGNHIYFASFKEKRLICGYNNY